MSKFHHGDQGRPFFRLVQGEQPQVGFQFLVYPFCFPISLWMIGGGEGNIVLEEMGKFLGKGRDELWSSVQDNL